MSYLSVDFLWIQGNRPNRCLVFVLTNGLDTPAFPSKPFESLEAAREWVLIFVHWYNEEHRHSGIQFVTPAQRHDGKDRRILANRDTVYALAKERHPERWSGETRNWTPVAEVWLNPEKQDVPSDELLDEVA